MAEDEVQLDISIPGTQQEAEAKQARFSPPPDDPVQNQNDATGSNAHPIEGNDNERYRRYRSRKRKRKRSPSSSSNSSSTSSSSSRSRSPVKKTTKRLKTVQQQRFKVILSKDRNAWKLSADLAKYANNTKYISDKDIQENILADNLVPKNIQEPLKMDVFINNLLQETGNSFEISRDKQLSRINSKLREVYGPLTKVLQQVDEFQ